MMRILMHAAFWAGLLAAPGLDAATYFVRNGGDDGAGGLSHETAWATLDRVRQFDFLPGDRLLFEQGGHWQGQLIVDWAGTEESPVVVGAYYLEGDTPVRGFETARPIIDGADKLPVEPYDGLVRVTAPRVRIENLEVVNSEGRAIMFGNAEHGEVAGCLTRNAYKGAITFVDSDFASVHDNFVTLAGMAFPEDRGVWSGAIELVRSDQGVVDSNTVAEVYGEGINANDGSTGVVIENNEVFSARSAGIYLDAAPRATVRRNLVYGTSNPEFWRGGETTGPGIVLNNEVYHYERRSLAETVQSRRARIYANAVAYTRAGIAFWGQFEETSYEDTLVFNNTLVENDTQLVLGGRPKPGSMLVNNILLSISPGTADVDKGGSPAVVVRNNYFSDGEPGPQRLDDGNLFGDLRLARMSEWRSIGRLHGVSREDFAPVAGSLVVGAAGEMPRRIAESVPDFDLDLRGLAHGEPMDLGAVRAVSSGDDAADDKAR